MALDARTVAILREHRASQAAERLLAGPAWEELGLVFSDELGRVVNPAWFTRMVKALATDAGVPPLTPHPAARHTWATLALSSGIPAKVKPGKCRCLLGVGGPTHHLTTPPPLAKTYFLAA